MLKTIRINKGKIINNDEYEQRMAAEAASTADVPEPVEQPDQLQDKHQPLVDPDQPKPLPRLSLRARAERRKVMIVSLVVLLLIVSIIAVGAVVLVVIPVQRVIASANKIMATVDQLKDDLDGKDLTGIDGYFADINNELENISGEVDNYEFLKDFELTRGYYNNLQVVRELSQKSQEIIALSLPDLKLVLESMGYKVDADSDLEVNSDEEDEEQIHALIRELPKVVELYDSIEPEILELIEIFNRLDTAYIPSIGSGGFKGMIIDAQALTIEFPTVSAQLKQTLSVMPDLLGSDDPASYLVVFQNEKEMRGSGGLLTAYGNLQIDKGEMGDEVHAKDMWDLEGYVSWTLGIDVGYRNIYGQNALMNAGCGSTYLRAQDSGIYPDLYVSLNMFKDYYNVANQYNPEKYPDYDHIIILNTFFASDMVSLVEPLDLPEHGEVVTSQNLAHRITYQTANAVFNIDTRKNFMADVATAVKDKFNELDSSDFFKIVQMLIKTIQEKNIAFYSKNPDVQGYFDELGLSARVEHNFAGDYFHLNEAQNCSLKSNFYLRNNVTQDIHIAPDGNIRKDVNVHWIQSKVYDPEEDNILSSNYAFQYRAWVRLFMPPGSSVESTDGYAKSQYFYFPVTYYDELMGKEISDNIIWYDHRRMSEFEPVKEHDLNVTYHLPEELKYSPSSGYRQLIQKHPGKRDEAYTINIHEGGRVTSVTFRLDRDKIVSYRNGVITLENYDERLDQYLDIFQKLENI